MTNFNNYLGELGHLPFLLELPSTFRGRVREFFKQVSSEKTYAKGDTLYSEGDQDMSTGALLVKGSVEIHRGDGPPIARKAPELFGEMMLLDENDRRTATLTISEESIVYEFKWDDLMAKAKDELSDDQILDLKYALVKYAGSRFDELDELDRS